MQTFEADVIRCLEVLQNGGLILYPTDTVWGIGCDATHEKAIEKIYNLKQRSDSKSMIVLMAEERDVLQWIASVDLSVFDFVAAQQRPTTVVFEHALGLPQNLVAADGSLAIRLVQDAFCRHLIKRLRKPIVSTSANISGQPAPQTFTEIDAAIKAGVDYVVQWRQDEATPAQPSQIMRWKAGAPEWIRK